MVAMMHLGSRKPRFTTPEESLVIETVPVAPSVFGEAVVDGISAVKEAHRCLRCEDSPCSAACPAGVDISNFTRRIGASDFSGAARLIREVNPLGNICGEICPAERLCESACVRNGLDKAVRIGQLEAFACGMASGKRGWPKARSGPTREKVAVIGSGPAGISCAYYLSLLDHQVEVFEKTVEAGGLPMRAMPEFRLARQLLLGEIEEAFMAGIEFRGNTSLGQDVNLESLWREGFHAAFLAPGLQSMTWPQIPGGDLPGVIGCLSFLESARRKVMRELTPRVVVLGDSNLTFDVAVVARRMGAEKVFVLSRRNDARMRVSADTRQAALEEGIEVVTGRTPVEFLGNGRVHGVKTADPEGAGVQTGEYVLEAGTVIVAEDRRMEKELGEYLAGQLRMNEDGTIQVEDRTMMTSRTGVFAGGDAAGGERLVAVAVAHGRRAALAIDDYLGSLSSA